MKTLREQLVSTNTRIYVIGRNLKFAYKIINLLKTYGIPVDITTETATHEYLNTIKLIASEGEYQVHGDLIMVPESEIDERILIAIALVVSTTRVLNMGIDPGRRTGLVVLVDSTLCLWRSFRSLERLLDLIDKSISLVINSYGLSVERIVLRIGSSISRTTLERIVSIARRYYSKVNLVVELVDESKSAPKINIIRSLLDIKLTRDLLSAFAISTCRGIPIKICTE
ncbi:MAG: hypothetical protein DRJ49_03145 [Thermoprotei archaeon]|nr:MAG: hypothetical protein DRJ49_03145 [Thermoprotei archaeon]